ncbi:MAG: spherulation-specific family 4 protein [Nitrososphaera sp.]|nr:spherulation-specific family 4 protein [Nitrososphaera sp.]
MVIVSAVFAAAIAASFLLPYAKVTYAKSENLYVIYYGHLVDRAGAMTVQASKILASDPELVIVPHSFPDGELNLTPEVRQAFTDQGIKVVTYTWTDYGLRDLAEVKLEIDRQLAESQVDGIFVDEVTNIESDREYLYYSEIYRHVKSNDPDAMVIMNPGHYKVSERIMSISDIVSLEEEWVFHNDMLWKPRYPPSEFMGVSSNEYCGQCVDGSIAAARTTEAWDAGIGYHFSTDRYVDIPAWFDSYAAQVNKEKMDDSAAGS